MRDIDRKLSKNNNGKGSQKNNIGFESRPRKERNLNDSIQQKEKRRDQSTSPELMNNHKDIQTSQENVLKKQENDRRDNSTSPNNNVSRDEATSPNKFPKE